MLSSLTLRKQVRISLYQLTGHRRSSQLAQSLSSISLASIDGDFLDLVDSDPRSSP